MRSNKARATLSFNHRKMSLDFNKYVDKLPSLTLKEKRIERFLYFVIAIIIFGWFLFLVSSNWVFLKRIIAEQNCPLTIDLDGKVHGQQTLTPTAGNNYFDCSSLDIVIASDGEVIVDSYINHDTSNTNDYGGVLAVQSLTVEAGGKITATGKGYANTDADNTAGNGSNATGNSAGSGGGHGGAGGEGIAADPDPAADGGNAYGDSESPLLLGGGGGKSGSNGAGGVGGGAIKIVASGAVTVNGTIAANGTDGATDNSSSGGGGAGGSIWIESNTLGGNGTVEARGGGSQTAQYRGGGGGGGRIIMFCTTTNTYTGTASVTGGTAGSAQDGGNGSLLGPTCKPHAPTASLLKQYKTDQLTNLPVGSATAEGQFLIYGDLYDTDTNETLILQVEIKQLGTSFSNSLTHAQSVPVSSPKPCNTEALTDCGKVSITGLTTSKEYHWQARVKDSKGGFSSWVSFGDNAESDRDILLSGTPYSMSIYGGNNQTGVVYTTLSNTLQAKIVDSMGFGVPGVTVNWLTVDGKTNGTFIDGTYHDGYYRVETDVNGIATNHYKLGQKTGTNTMRAYVSGLVNNPLNYSATGTPGDLNSFTVSGPTYAIKDTNFTLSITALDLYGNVKTDYTGSPTLTPVEPFDISTVISGGYLSPISTTFIGADNGVKEISTMQYGNVDSIKIRVTDGGVNGYSNIIAVILSLGSCPDVDGIVDVNEEWIADGSNMGIFDCRNVERLQVTNSATLTLTSYDGTGTSDIGVTILANNIQVDVGALISADGKGYGTGKCYSGSTQLSSGGTHGGYGSLNTTQAPYGNMYQPTTLGCSGAYYNFGAGTAGGGAIKLEVVGEGELIVDGNITSNGITTANDDGHGAGGSIWISTHTIRTTGSGGTISTDGGGYGFPGGGGRIAIYYFNGNYPVTNSSKVHAFGGYPGTNSRIGGPGTVFIKQDSDAKGSLYVNNNSHNGPSAGINTDSGSYFSFDKISLKGYGHLSFFGDNSIVLQVDNNSELTGDNTMPTLYDSGIFKFNGSNPLVLSGVNLAIGGKDEGITDITIGDTYAGGLTLYPHTWWYNSTNTHSYSDITVNSNGVLTTKSYSSTPTDGNYQDDYGIVIGAENITVNEGGKISGNGEGYAIEAGPGSNDEKGYPLGGSHGGFGGDGTGNTSSNGVVKYIYGDYSNAKGLGSGGSGCDSRVGLDCANGGAGGSAVTLNISGTLVNNGTISEDGNPGEQYVYGGGGGAGGSVNINASVFNGSGILSTNGGAGGSGAFTMGGSGSGGRISIRYNSGNFPITNRANVQSRGALGYNSVYSGAGTVYIYRVNNNSHHLYIDNNTTNSTYTILNAALPAGNYSFTSISLLNKGNLQILGAGTGCSLTGYWSQTSCENATGTWNAGSTLTISSSDAITGDSSSPDLLVDGTFIGPSDLSIEGYDLNITGDTKGVSNITLGSTVAGGLSLYANTWNHDKTHGFTFGNITVGGVGTLTTYSKVTTPTDSSYLDDYGPGLTVDNLSISSGGKIYGDGLGYAAETGPGSHDNKENTPGGSHGGFGGGGTNNYSPDGIEKYIYDDYSNPTGLGSGGNACDSRMGSDCGYPAAGGSSIRLKVNNTLTNNGTISMNGVTGTGAVWAGGSGAGGSINIETNVFNGSGLLTVNGGAGAVGVYSIGGAGSGGRIAVKYTSGNYPLSDPTKVQARGGLSYGSIYSGAGTVFINNSNSNTRYLYVDNNLTDTTKTILSAALPKGSYNFDAIRLTNLGNLSVLGSGTGCTVSNHWTETDCINAGGIWDGGGILTLTSSSGLQGDSTNPGLIIFGTLRGPDESAFNIDGVNVTIQGDITNINNMVIGANQQAGMTLYAHSWIHDKDHQYSFGDVTLGSTGTITVKPYIPTPTDTNYLDDYSVGITFENLTIASGGKIYGTGLGYAAETGLGSNDGKDNYYGASHGGYATFETNSKYIYDDYTNPTGLGSGGNSSDCRDCSAGTKGGAAVTLNITGTFIHNGTIAMNGITSNDAVWTGGAGAGGSVNITANVMNGTGTIQANGGNSYDGMWGSGGSGSGGRIAIRYNSGNYPFGNPTYIQARGGYNNLYGYAGAGTVYIYRLTDGNKALYVDNNLTNLATAVQSAVLTANNYSFDLLKLTKRGNLEILGEGTGCDLEDYTNESDCSANGGSWDKGSTLILSSSSALQGDSTSPTLLINGTLQAPTDFTIDGVNVSIKGNTRTITNIVVGDTLLSGLTLYAHTWAHNNELPYVFGNISIGSSGTLYVKPYIPTPTDSNYQDDYSVGLTVNNLTIANGGSLNGNGLGYASNTGPGTEYSDSSLQGGSHGGFGGTLRNTSYIYDDYKDPTGLGSGGHTCSDARYCGVSGNGGGAVQLIVNNTLTNNGTITMNGLAGNHQVYGGGGGAGGTINIIADTINGSGSITANGGQGGAQDLWGWGQGGSGGRISATYQSGNFDFSSSTHIQAYGALGAPSTYGGPGSIYIKLDGALGTLVFDNNTHTGATALDAIDYRLDTIKILRGSVIDLKSDTTNDRGVRFVLDSLFQLDSTSQINGVGKGFGSAAGPGKGSNGVNSGGGGGAGYGGSGGTSEPSGGVSSNGGISYGDQTRPSNLGSGGGAAGTGAAGGAGGGAFNVILTDGTANIAGLINVSGENGKTASPGGGGGSGGSILIIAKYCNISGDLTSNGGNGGDDIVDGGGGGGGRISILVNGPQTNCTASGDITYTYGTSAAGGVGQAGTFPGVVTLPQIEAADQYTPEDLAIPVGGKTSETTVKMKILVSDPGASVISPKNLKAEIELVPTDESFTQVLGSVIVTTNTQQYSGGDAVQVEASIPGLAIGESYKWQVRVINVTENLNGNWEDYGNNGTSADFSIAQTAELRASVSSNSVSVGDPISLTVSAYDSFGAVDTGYRGTIDFVAVPETPSNPAVLPLSYVYGGSDNGVKIFNNGVIFNLAGTYQVRITDRNNPTLTVDTETITVSGVIPTLTPTLAPTLTPTLTPTVQPTLTETPVPTVPGQTPSPTVTVTGTVTITLTPTVTGSPEPTVTGTVTITPTTSPSITGIVTVTPTPSVNVIYPVEISNVHVNLNTDGTTANICWDTNIPTISNIDYGLETDNALTLSTNWTDSYATHVCINLTSLRAYAAYLFTLNSVSAQSQSDSYSGRFKVNEVVVTITPPANCIVEYPIATNADRDLIVQYRTSSQAICMVKYGTQANQFDKFGVPTESLKALLHSSTLDTAEINDDLYYRISCSVDSPTGQIACEKKDVVTYCRFGNCTLPETGTTQLTVPEIAIIPITGAVLAVNVIANSNTILYGFIMLKKPKRKSTWGVIYDEKTKKPVPFAVIRILDKTGKLVKQDITDPQGRYGFILEPGTYKMTIVQNDYKENSFKVNIKDKDDLLTNDIGITPKGRKASNIFIRIKTFIIDNISVINTILIFVGLIFSLIAFFINPVVLNAVILVVYIIEGIYFVSVYLSRSWGTIVDNYLERPVSGAFVHLYDINESRQVDVQVTDEKGRFRFKVSKGKYLIKVDANGYVFPSAKADDKDIFISKSGERFIFAKNVKKAITNRIVLDKSSSRSSTLRNPFD